MRRLKRPNRRRKDLAAWSKLAGQERAHNVREGRKKKKTKKKTKKKRSGFTFEMYRHKAVKAALRDMCNKKCAYCESDFAGTSDAHIEHYRPKSAMSIAGKRVSPGYYWLAAEWSNLLWSCTRCNCIREYTFETATGRQKFSLGKGDRFPVRGKHATRPGGEGREKRLLIDPCRDDPSKLLSFDPKTGIVRARRGCSRASRQMVEASIRVYALNRPDLVRGRRKTALGIEDQQQRVKDCRRRIRAFERAGLKNDAAEEKATLKKEKKILDGYLAKTEPFLLMASQLTRRRIPV